MAPSAPGSVQADGAGGTVLSKGRSAAGNTELALSLGRNDAPAW